MTPGAWGRSHSGIRVLDWAPSASGCCPLLRPSWEGEPLGAHRGHTRVHTARGETQISRHDVSAQRTPMRTLSFSPCLHPPSAPGLTWVGTCNSSLQGKLEQGGNSFPNHREQGSVWGLELPQSGRAGLLCVHVCVHTCAYVCSLPCTPAWVGWKERRLKIQSPSSGPFAPWVASGSLSSLGCKMGAGAQLGGPGSQGLGGPGCGSAPRRCVGRGVRRAGERPVAQR